MSESLRHTPLYDTHVSLGARMAPFGGWDMPIQYASILDEARSVRAGAGLFDVSHMGRVEIRGTAAATFISSIFSASVLKLRIGRARYGVICNDGGGIIDDCIVYRRAEDRFLLVPNASNTPDVLDWISRWSRDIAALEIEEITSAYAMIAIQGPRAAAIIDEIAPDTSASVRLFSAIDTRLGDIDTLLARTGYTGEDGFELIVPEARAAELWATLQGKGAAPCGLGARDVLRLEAGLLLHGNDMDTSANPYEAGLDRFVVPDRDGYIPREALLRIQNQGVKRRLVGFNMIGRGIPRHGYPITDGAKTVGQVTSGSYSPTLDRNIGMGYVPTGLTEPGTEIFVDVRGRIVEAAVTALPFYSRRKIT